MRQFRWLAAGAPPAVFDLRRLGWRLRDDPAPAGEGGACPLLVLATGLALPVWLNFAAAAADSLRWTALLGIDDPLQRSRMLRIGYGEALGWGVSLDELAVRVERLAERAVAVARLRRIGALQIDLIARDAFVAGRALGLFPREFDLLWRLAETPGIAVSARQLLRDVWRLSFRPETNSLAVHVSRLRARLRLAGLDGLIETLPDGAYRLAVGAVSERVAASLPRGGGKLALDAYPRLGKEWGEPDRQQRGQEQGHAA